MPLKIPLPKGSVGLTFQGTPPVVILVKPDSPLKKRVKEGYVVEAVLFDKAHQSTVPGSRGTPALVKALNESKDETGRTLVFKIGTVSVIQKKKMFGIGELPKTQTQSLVQRLRFLDTSSLCDAADAAEIKLRVLHPDIQRINPNHGIAVMVGIVRTVRLTEPDDYLPTMRGIDEARPDDVLVVHTCKSTRAVAGELYAKEAYNRDMAGLVILDGPMRDKRNIQKAGNKTIPCFAPFTTPYSGTKGSVGEMQVPLPHVNHGPEGDEMTEFEVAPGDLIVGDDDGIVVGSEEDFGEIVGAAEKIMLTEKELLRLMTSDGQSLHELTTYEKHMEKRLKGEESKMELRM